MESDISLSSLESVPLREAPRAQPADPAYSEFAAAVLSGLSRRPRQIPCRFFYDAKGSELFEQITQLEEYYPTRVETELLQRYRLEIAQQMGEARVLVEFGSGSSRKTSLVLDALQDAKSYVPIDVSDSSLTEASSWLKQRHRELRITPLIADFTAAVALPRSAGRGKRGGFFSGSTIGNLTQGEAREFLANAARLLGKGSTFLIGVDLKKSLDVLLPAYNDAKGVTAAFNLNLLARANRELDGTFELGKFYHDASWNERKGRIEIHIVSKIDQVAQVLGRDFRFRAGERIHTENSHKYTVAEFQDLARRAGWHPAEVWTDAEQLFSLHLLKA